MDAISFGTDGWRATLDTFTSDRVRIVGQAVATYLRETGADAPVAVGYDARESSPRFADDLADVLIGNGFDVLVPPSDCPTPVVAWTVTDRDLSGGLMLTASHNPPEYNGVKFLPEDGAPALPDVTDELEANLAEPDFLPEDEHGEVRETEFVEPYLDHARSYVECDLSGLTVAYDAMHGSGRGVTDQLLQSCGASVKRLRCERDPEFGGSPPEPTAEHLNGLVETVREDEADLGVANDGDADRLAVVTPDGHVDANRLFAALYDHLLTERPGDAIRTVSTTFLVDRVAAAHGQSVHETAVGFKWVAEAMEEYDALVGGEESGGFGLTDHLRNKDGILLALVVAAAASEERIEDRIERLLAKHGEIFQDRVSVDCPDDRKQSVLDELETRIPDEVAGVDVERVNTIDGFKILLADGSWLLVRPSGTEPKLRIYAESSGEERVETLLAAGQDLVEPLISP